MCVVCQNNQQDDWRSWYITHQKDRITSQHLVQRHGIPLEERDNLADQSKVLSYVAGFEVLCRFCGHRFSSWRERCYHIKGHYNTLEMPYPPDPWQENRPSMCQCEDCLKDKELMHFGTGLNDALLNQGYHHHSPSLEFDTEQAIGGGPESSMEGRLMAGIREEDETWGQGVVHGYPDSARQTSHSPCFS